MINLLPPQEKEKFLWQKREKITIIFWFFGFYFSLCLIIFLFLLNLHLENKIETQEKLLERAGRTEERIRIKKLQEEMKNANLVFSDILSFYKKKIYFSEIIEKISKKIPEQLFLTDISITLSTDQKKEEKRFFRVSLSGFAPNREILFKFKKNLEEEEKIKEVSFPLSNWVKAKDINFFVNFSIKPDL